MRAESYRCESPGSRLHLQPRCPGRDYPAPRASPTHVRPSPPYMRRCFALRLPRVAGRLLAVVGRRRGRPPTQRHPVRARWAARARMVSMETAPALASLAREGVTFRNSHSVYPTLTMPNAAAMATGHYPGDTGVFGNSFLLPFSGAKRRRVARAADRERRRARRARRAAWAAASSRRPRFSRWRAAPATAPPSSASTGRRCCRTTPPGMAAAPS